MRVALLFFTILFSFSLGIRPCFAQSEELPEAGLLPTSPLYFLKTVGEKVQILLAFDPVGRAEVYLEMADVRLAEAKALLEADKKEMVAKSLLAYQDKLQQAWESLELAQQQEQAVGEARTHFEGVLDQREELLEELRLTAGSQLEGVFKMVLEKNRELLRKAVAGVDSFNQEATPVEPAESSDLRQRFNFGTTFISPVAEPPPR